MEDVDGMDGRVKDRFDGSDGLRRVASVMSRSVLAAGDPRLSEALAARAEVRSYSVGEVLIVQDASDSDVAVLLAGRVEILVNGHRVALREPAAVVGEMSAMDPSRSRSASVRALEHTVAAWISELELTALAREFPDIWRRLAIELAERLRQRGRFHGPPNTRPRVFVGSASERLPVAAEVELGLGAAVDVERWDKGTFRPSRYAVPELSTALDRCDFGVFCMGADDVVRSRGKAKSAPRDNVIFEAGLFVGGLGLERVFLLVPRGAGVRLPSDVLGAGLLEYDSSDLSVLDESCRRMLAAIAAAGPKARLRGS